MSNLTDETMDEIAYAAIEAKGTDDMRGTIHVLGIDHATTSVAARYTDNLEDGMRLRGMLLAIYQAGQLAGLEQK